MNFPIVELFKDSFILLTFMQNEQKGKEKERTNNTSPSIDEGMHSVLLFFCCSLYFNGIIIMSMKMIISIVGMMFNG